MAAHTMNLQHPLAFVTEDTKSSPIVCKSTSMSSASDSSSAYDSIAKFPPTMPFRRSESSSYEDAARTGYGVRALRKADIEPAAIALAEAFEQDAMAQYFTHTPDREHCSAREQWRLHLEIMIHMVKAHVLCGLATVIGDNYNSVALWMPPGSSMDSRWFKWFGPMQPRNLGRKLSPEGRTRFFNEFLPKLHDAKQDVLRRRDDRSWYLVYVGTRPQSRMQGYARRLIEHTLREADRQQSYCYLESSNVLNNHLYNSLGFRHQTFLHFTRTEPPVELDVMTRAPSRVI